MISFKTPSLSFCWLGRGSRTTSTLDGWIPQLFCVTKKKTSQKSITKGKNYTQICHCQRQRNMQPICYPCIYLSLSPFQKGVTTCSHNLSSTQPKCKCSWGMQVFKRYQSFIEAILVSPKHISLSVRSLCKVYWPVMYLSPLFSKCSNSMLKPLSQLCFQT